MCCPRSLFDILKPTALKKLNYNMCAYIYTNMYVIQSLDQFPQIQNGYFWQSKIQSIIPFKVKHM